MLNLLKILSWVKKDALPLTEEYSNFATGLLSNLLKLGKDCSEERFESTCELIESEFLVLHPSNMESADYYEAMANALRRIEQTTALR